MRTKRYLWMFLAISGCNVSTESPPESRDNALDHVVEMKSTTPMLFNDQKSLEQLQPVQEPELSRQGYCARDSLGKTICATVGGSAKIDRLGQVVCGPGQCVLNNLGEILCSSQPGGEAMINGTGEAVCVGGCVEARSSYCQPVQ